MCWHEHDRHRLVWWIMSRIFVASFIFMVSFCKSFSWIFFFFFLFTYVCDKMTNGNCPMGLFVCMRCYICVYTCVCILKAFKYLFISFRYSFVVQSLQILSWTLRNPQERIDSTFVYFTCACSVHSIDVHICRERVHGQPTVQ